MRCGVIDPHLTSNGFASRRNASSIKRGVWRVPTSWQPVHAILDACPERDAGMQTVITLNNI